MLDLRFRSVALGIAVGAGIGAGGAYAYLNRSPASVVQKAPAADLIPGGPKASDEASVFRVHSAFKFGIPQTDTLRFYEGFVASFDGRTRNPKWVLEHITKESLQGEGTRESSSFYEDQGLEPRLRNRLDDFKDSGYDRGHMAPAANHRASQKAMDDTFSLSNISPQVGPGFNRDYWARFEKFVKDAVKVSDGVYIVTGPLWLPQQDARGSGKWEMRHPMIGKPPQLVSVPTHYYKVVLAENSSGKHGQHSAAVGAFVMPNAPIDPQTPVTAFAVPLEALESVAGAKFFPGFVNDKRRAALDAAALSWQADGRSRLKVLDRMSVAEHHAALLPAQAAAPAATSRGNNSSKAAVAPPAPAAQDSVQRQQKTVNGEGAVHLCDVLACKLPAERWWENNGSGKGGSSSKGLPRSGSRGGKGFWQESAMIAEAAYADLEEYGE